jgi:hypothetical protein
MFLPVISNEQNNIIEKLKNNNVVVESVAGSGKTTTSLYIAKYFSNNKILLLTYNAKLKLETREKIKNLEIKNMEIHSYHSFCVKNYDKKCFTDSNIIALLSNNAPIIKNINYDLIILDEAQDITPLYYELICKIYKDNLQKKDFFSERHFVSMDATHSSVGTKYEKKNVKICMFGDIKQSIFDFNHSDSRYIVFSERLFHFNIFNWEKCFLSESFRITYEMSLFINKCLLHDDKLISKKITHNKPRYIICDCFVSDNGNCETFNEVKYYLNMGYNPEDIFILAPSLRSDKSPVRQLENKIKRELPNIQVYVPTSDDEKLDSDILNGKLIFSTFHQTKGLERKVVIIFNFDNSYFKFYKKVKTTFLCPNELYVATTRGIDHLTLFHHKSFDYLPFISKNKLKQYCDFYELKSIFISNDSPSQEKELKKKVAVTDLIKHIPQKIVDECFFLLELKTINTKKELIDIPIKTNQEKGCESVSEITGIAIPSFFELKIKGELNIYNLLTKEYHYEEEIIKKRCCLLKNKQHKNFKLENIIIHTEKLEMSELLYICNCWNSFKTGYLFKIYQIQNYDWLSKENLYKSIERLENSLHISSNSSFEVYCKTENFKELYNIELNGYIDCVDNNNIYEFKCVKNLEKEHFLQLAVYMYQCERKKEIEIKMWNDQINIFQNKLNILEMNERSIKTNFKVGELVEYRLFSLERGKIVKIPKDDKNNLILKNILTNKKINIPISFVKKIDENLQSIKKSKCETTTKKESSNLINIKIEEDNETILKEKIQILKQKINNYNEPFNYFIYNILTDELIQIDCNLNLLIQMIEKLIYNKYFISNIIDDDLFLSNNRNIQKKYEL